MNKRKIVLHFHLNTMKSSCLAGEKNNQLTSKDPSTPNSTYHLIKIGKSWVYCPVPETPQKKNAEVTKQLFRFLWSTRYLTDVFTFSPIWELNK